MAVPSSVPDGVKMGGSLEFGSLDSTGPVYIQIAERLRAKILSGDLQPGFGLPTVRSLSGELGVSVQTVFSAYRTLAREGLIAAHTRRGTVVAAPRKKQHALNMAAKLDAESGPVMQFERTMKAAGLYSMATELTDPALFRHDEFFAYAGALSSVSPWSLSAGPIEGDGKLRELTSGFLTRHGLPCTAKSTLMTMNELTAFGIALRALTDPGEPVLVQEPNFFSPVGLLSELERTAVPIRSNREGFDLDELAQRAKNSGSKCLVWKTQFGDTEGTRLAEASLVRTAEAINALDMTVIEFDTCRLMCHEGAATPLSALIPERCVTIHCLGSHLALGFGMAALVVPEYAKRSVRASLLASGAQTPTWTQVAFAQYLFAGHLDDHMLRLVAKGRQRIVALDKSLHLLRRFGVSWTMPKGGHRVWVKLPDGVSATRLYDAALEKGVAVLPGPVKLSGPDAESWAGLSCSVLDPEQTTSAVGLLAEALEGLSIN